MHYVLYFVVIVSLVVMHINAEFLRSQKISDEESRKIENNNINSTDNDKNNSSDKKDIGNDATKETKKEMSRSTIDNTKQEERVEEPGESPEENTGEEQEENREEDPENNTEEEQEENKEEDPESNMEERQEEQEELAELEILEELEKKLYEREKKLEEREEELEEREEELEEREEQIEEREKLEELEEREEGPENDKLVDPYGQVERIALPDELQTFIDSVIGEQMPIQINDASSLSPPESLSADDPPVVPSIEELASPFNLRLRIGHLRKVPSDLPEQQLQEVKSNAASFKQQNEEGSNWSVYWLVGLLACASFIIVTCIFIKCKRMGNPPISRASYLPVAMKYSVD